MRMSDNLHNCIENMKLTPFPKMRRKLKLRKQTEKVLSYSIAADCAALCEFPNSYDDMVQCDAKTCQNWFHYKCAGLNSPTDSRAYPGSKFVVANTLAKWKKIEPNKINFSQGLSQKV